MFGHFPYFKISMFEGRIRFICNDSFFNFNSQRVFSYYTVDSVVVDDDDIADIADVVVLVLFCRLPHH